MSQKLSSNSRSLSAVFCEDLRREMTGQISLIGVYPTAYLPTTFPVKIPRLTCYMTLHMSIDDVSSTIKFEVYGADKSLLGEYTASPPPEDFIEATRRREDRVQLGVVIEMESITFDGPTVVHVRATVDDEVVNSASQLIVRK